MSREDPLHKGSATLLQGARLVVTVGTDFVDPGAIVSNDIQGNLPVSCVERLLPDCKLRQRAEKKIAD